MTLAFEFRVFDIDITETTTHYFGLIQYII